MQSVLALSPILAAVPDGPDAIIPADPGAFLAAFQAEELSDTGAPPVQVWPLTGLAVAPLPGPVPAVSASGPKAAAQGDTVGPSTDERAQPTLDRVVAATVPMSAEEVGATQFANSAGLVVTGDDAGRSAPPGRPEGDIVPDGRFVPAMPSRSPVAAVPPKTEAKGINPDPTGTKAIPVADHSRQSPAGDALRPVPQNPARRLPVEWTGATQTVEDPAGPSAPPSVTTVAPGSPRTLHTGRPAIPGPPVSLEMPVSAAVPDLADAARPTSVPAARQGIDEGHGARAEDPGPVGKDAAALLPVATPADAEALRIPLAADPGPVMPAAEGLTPLDRPRVPASPGFWERLFNSLGPTPEQAGPAVAAKTPLGLPEPLPSAPADESAIPSPAGGTAEAEVPRAALPKPAPQPQVTPVTVPVVMPHWTESKKPGADRLSEDPFLSLAVPQGMASVAVTAAPAGGALTLPVPQVAAQITAALAQSADGATELALSPEELGHVRLRLEPDSANPDRMVVTITFERPETLDLFRRHAADLAEALRAAGYSGADIDFGQGKTGGNGQSGSARQAEPVPDLGVTDPDPLPAPRLLARASLDLRL